MRRIALAALAVLVFAPAANADCGVTSSVVSGSSPLRVSFTASCQSAVYQWSFGDGEEGQGQTIEHVYSPGRFTPALTTDAGAQTLAPVTSIALQLFAPHRVRYAQRVTLRARVVPGDVPVRLGRRRFRRGKLAIVVTHPTWTAVAGGVTARVSLLVVSRLEVRLVGSPTVGSQLHVFARLHPSGAGTVRIRVDGRPTTRVDTSSTRTPRIVVSAVPRKNWTGPYRVLRPAIVSPNVQTGSRGPGVRALERRLLELHYALRGADGYFGDDDYAAVLAFQKVNGLGRTGAVTADLWRRLAAAHLPFARYGGTHVEIDKTRQVLFLVRDGKVAEVVHVSTGATGNTPVGLWHVYSKVPGWSWVLWYPNFFLRGFAIHGYPSVPAYPASHGCVRVPMWVAPSLYEQIPDGFPVYVYY